MATSMQEWQAENELFLAWCETEGICPDDGAPLNSDHDCDPSQWFGPPIPEGLSQYPPGMSVD